MIYSIEDKTQDMAIGISHIPNRKNMCLFVREGNIETKYAVFNSDEVAELFMKKLCKFMGVKEERGKENGTQ